MLGSRSRLSIEVGCRPELHGVWRFQIRPPLVKLSSGNSPNHDSAKFNLLVALYVCSYPVIPHHNLVVFAIKSSMVT